MYPVSEFSGECLSFPGHYFPSHEQSKKRRSGESAHFMLACRKKKDAGKRNAMKTAEGQGYLK